MGARKEESNWYLKSIASMHHWSSREPSCRRLDHVHGLSGTILGSSVTPHDAIQAPLLSSLLPFRDITIEFQVICFQ